jgi:hypothetical protein
MTNFHYKIDKCLMGLFSLQANKQDEDNMENETGNFSTSTTAAPDDVTIRGAEAKTVNATHVTLRQGGIQSSNSESLTIRQGGVMKATTDHLDMVQAGAGMVRTGTATLTASKAAVMIASGEVRMDQSSARMLVAGGPVSIDQGASVFTISNNARVQNSAVVFLIARNVEGDIKPVFGQQESILFGAIAGLVAGTLIMLGNLFRRKRRG